MSHDESALRLALSFAKASRAVREESLVARGVLRAFEQALIEALLRHKHWRKTPLFKDALDDHLCRDFGLPRAIVERLSAALLASPGDHTDEAPEIVPVPPSDDEFVRYVCVESATAQSESQLASDLKLGDQLFRRIKEAMQWLAAGRSDQARFATELDAKIADVLCDLAKELKVQPLALWAHRLRYVMTHVEAPWREALAEHGGFRFLQLLVTVGKRGETSVRQLAPKVAQLFPEFAAAEPVALTTHLLECLERLALIRPASGTGKDPAASKWRLLPLGEELTAEAFARNHLNVGGDDCLAAETLASFPAAYQAAVVRLAPEDDVGLFKRLVQETRPLSSQGLAALLQRIVEADGPGSAASVADDLLCMEASPWVRAAACHAAEQAAGLDIGQSLTHVAESDASSVVRTAALRATLERLSRKA